MPITGLTSQEAEENRKVYGLNEIRQEEKISPLKILLSQFVSPLIIILIVAAFLSVVIGYLPGQVPNFVDASLILFIVFISGLAGFVQEYKAEKSIEALRLIATPTIQVIRSGQVVFLTVTEITVNDIVIVEAGDIVPADAEIVESFNLNLDESVLTGESAAIEKQTGAEVYMNTAVSSGSAKIKITKVGMQTKIGRIADKLQKIRKEKTSFEKEIIVLSRKIFWLIGLIAVVIFVINFIKFDLYTSLLTSISLAVAAIPEGLPAVVVLALALGAKTMYKNHALVRKLNVIESIGAVDIICSDKTGTITKNEMLVAQIYLNGANHNVDMIKDKKTIAEIEPLIKCGVICNNVRIEGHPEGNRKYFGEQTEIGLIKIAEDFGIFKETIDSEYVRINEVSFSSDRKMMSVVVTNKSRRQLSWEVYAKGAPEVLLKACNRILIGNRVKRLSTQTKKEILEQNKNYASNALRVLGFAYDDKKDEKKDIEKDLIWIGLQAMIDPPHPEIESVLADCQTAGIRVMMITGDNPATAEAIASQIKLMSNGVLSGSDLDGFSEKKLSDKIEAGVNIFARTSPYHKLRILKILEKKYRVSMTGDGVNDALALKQSHVGVAMGLKGTTVAKEASDIVLLDDNFKSIVAAIRQGRRIFDNIRKFINYLLVSNFAEVMVLLISSIFMNLSKPILLPVQILWVNLLTDGLPALALGADPARKKIMQEPPRPKGEPIIDTKLGILIGAMGIKKTIVLLATFLLILPAGEDLARTALFTGFILYEFVRIASIRSQEKLTWLSNPWLLIALMLSLILQVIVIYSPLNVFFHATALGIYEWGILLAGVLVGYFLAIVITKAVVKYYSKPKK